MTKEDVEAMLAAVERIAIHGIRLGLSGEAARKLVRVEINHEAVDAIRAWVSPYYVVDFRTRHAPLELRGIAYYAVDMPTAWRAIGISYDTGRLTVIEETSGV